MEPLKVDKETYNKYLEIRRKMHWTTRCRLICGGLIFGSALAGVLFNDWRMTSGMIGGFVAGLILHRMMFKDTWDD